MYSFTSIECNGRCSHGIKKAFAIKACLVVGKEVEEKTLFPFSDLDQETGKYRKLTFPVLSIAVSLQYQKYELSSERTIKTMFLMCQKLRMPNISFFFPQATTESHSHFRQQTSVLLSQKVSTLRMDHMVVGV